MCAAMLLVSATASLPGGNSRSVSWMLEMRSLVNRHSDWTLGITQLAYFPARPGTGPKPRLRAVLYSWSRCA